MKLHRPETTFSALLGLQTWPERRREAPFSCVATTLPGFANHNGQWPLTPKRLAKFVSKVKSATDVVRSHVLANPPHKRSGKKSQASRANTQALTAPCTSRWFVQKWLPGSHTICQLLGYLDCAKWSIILLYQLFWRPVPHRNVVSFHLHQGLGRCPLLCVLDCQLVLHHLASFFSLCSPTCSTTKCGSGRLKRHSFEHWPSYSRPLAK